MSGQKHKAKYITTNDLVDRWGGGVCLATLSAWRMKKPQKGPPFVKIGYKVLYPIDKLEEWEAANFCDPAANENAEMKVPA